MIDFISILVSSIADLIVAVICIKFGINYTQRKVKDPDFACPCSRVSSPEENSFTEPVILNDEQLYELQQLNDSRANKSRRR